MMALLMGLKTISPAELLTLTERGGVSVFDVNAFQSWERNHVPTARHLDPQRFEAAMLPQSRDAELVFYCSNPMCRKAPLAAKRARDLGYANVRVMSAGIQGWLNASLPVESAAR